MSLIGLLGLLGLGLLGLDLWDRQNADTLVNYHSLTKPRSDGKPQLFKITSAERTLARTNILAFSDNVI